MPKRHSDTLTYEMGSPYDQNWFLRDSISNMSIIVDIIATCAINSNSRELQAMPPVKNYTGRYLKTVHRNVKLEVNKCVTL